MLRTLEGSALCSVLADRVKEYFKDEENRKCDSYIHNPDGTYSYNPNILLPGHGDKSVILAQKIVDLTDEEMACIRWHMGAFDDKENWDKYGKSIEKYPNVLWTHTADMMAARIFKI